MPSSHTYREVIGDLLSHVSQVLCLLNQRWRKKRQMSYFAGNLPICETLSPFLLKNEYMIDHKVSVVDCFSFHSLID